MDDGCPFDLDELDRLAGAGRSGASTDQTETAANGVSIIDAKDIRPKAVRWLWHGWLARGKLHILAGAPGTGKTTLALALAATVTVGGRWPDDTRAEVGRVVIWSGEDEPADILVPRMLATGADMARVGIVDGRFEGKGKRPFDPSKDMPALAEELSKNPPAVLIVDSIVSAVAGDSHKNAEVRRALQPLVDLAQSLGTAVIGITHLTKGTAGRDPTERVTGSLAFGALARVVLIAAKLPEEQGRALMRAKSNLGPDDGGFGYDVEPYELPDYPGVHTIRLSWGSAIEGSARDLMAAAEATGDDDDESGALAEAVAFLRSELEAKPVPAKAIRAEANGAGIAWRTVERAKTRLGVESRKDGPRGPWLWALPGQTQDRQGSQTQKDGGVGGVGNHGGVDHPETRANAEGRQGRQDFVFGEDGGVGPEPADVEVF